MAAPVTLSPINRVDDPVNILMVDDQPAKLLSYEAILRDLGENLVSASSAREALANLLKTDFAVILVDVCMPEHDGFELVEMIREHHRFREIPVIFVSAVQLTDLDRLKGYASGAVDFVSVPVIPTILRAKVAVFADLFRKTRDLARLNRELEQRVFEQTAELRETEKALKETDRRKNEFLAMLAHELRNPLAPMQNSLELLKRLNLKEPSVQGIADTCERQLSQLTRLINDLMDVSRITRDKLEMRSDLVDVGGIVSNAIESTKTLLENSQQTLQLRRPDGPVLINGDSVRLLQVLSNLINNAHKYTPVGGEIHVCVDANSRDVTFSVRDNGAGIDEHDLTHLFEPFYQANRTIDRSHGGLGIGLTLVKSIVEKHNGAIEVRSEGLNKGSEFIVRIPRKMQSKSVENGAQNEPPTQVEPAMRKVLVVDDNLDAADTLVRLLKHLGHDAVSVYDGASAIEKIEAIQPNIVFMDIGMPEMDGYETARRIRSQSWGRSVMLAALTGWGQDQDRAKSAEAGFDLHLVKPVGFDRLETVLAQYDDWQAAHQS